jgi:hypothetical protein
MIELNEVEISNKLADKGYNELVIDEILEILRNLPLILKFKSGEIKAGNHFSIELTTSKGNTAEEDDVLTTGDFKTKINGIDDKRIKSIEIPKLDASVLDPFILKIQYYPFNLNLPDYDISNWKF